jgi:hypothetical protein
MYIYIYIFLKGGSGVIGDLSCELNGVPSGRGNAVPSGATSRAPDAKTANTKLPELEWVEESGKREVRGDEWEKGVAQDGAGEDGVAGGEVACVGVCGGEWRFESCRIVAGTKLDAMRCSYASEVTVWGCEVGGISAASCASSAVTVLHRSRVVVERSVILRTEYAAMRALGRCRLALNHSRFDARTLYTLDIEADAHVALRNVYMHRVPELAVRQDKHCYEDTLPLYRPSLYCDWCPRWVGDLMRMDVELAEGEQVQATRAAVATANAKGRVASMKGTFDLDLGFDGVGGEGKVGELIAAPVLVPMFLQDDDSDDRKRDQEGGGRGSESDGLSGCERRRGKDSQVDLHTHVTHDCWLYYDKTLDGEIFVNGRQVPLGPTSAGPSVGSVIPPL